MAKEIVFEDQKVLDEFGDILTAGKENDTMMKELLSPIEPFIANNSLEYMLKNYPSLLWKFKTAKYYERYSKVLFLSYLLGNNSMQTERQKPFVDIKNFADMEIYAKEFLANYKDITLKQLLWAFDLTPEKAVEYFEKKGIAISKDWKEALKNCRKEAFTITKVKSLDILNDFKKMLLKALKEGMSIQDFRKQSKEMLEVKGWRGKKISDVPGQEKIDCPWRLNLIYRQNMQTAYSDGRWQNAQATQQTFPYIQMLSTIDKVTTKQCIGMNMLVMSIADSQIKYFLPPSHFHCRRRFRILNNTILKRRGYTVSKGASIPQLKNMKGFEFKGIGGITIDNSRYSSELIKELKKRTG